MPANVLDGIVADKRKRLDQDQKREPLKALAARCEKLPPPASFLGSINVKDQLSIIAEMKKQSPSAGPILDDYSPAKIAKIYEDAGARALSVLTEEDHFRGAIGDLEQARTASKLPVLRKDFVFDPYQVYQTRAIGASAVLLIVAILKADELNSLLKLARELKLDALVEVHDEDELNRALDAGPDCIGINNRNLKDLTTDVNRTFRMLRQVPKDVCIVSESGIKTPQTIRELKSAGVRAALIGESILKSKDPRELLQSFVRAGKD